MKLLYALFSLLFATTITAQTQRPATKYEPYNLFSPIFYPYPETITRSADGSPNAGYWQNAVDYNINVSLNDNTHVIAGYVDITYKNNSPHELPFLWLQLDQNLFAKNSRGQARMPVGSYSRYGDAGSNFDGGYKITDVKLLPQNSNVECVISDTRMQVRLPNALKPKGDETKLRINFSFMLPEYDAARCGILKTKNGDIFSVAQFFPRLCVYDDIQGWNTDPYLGPSEFYCEYGDYDLSITAPANHIVVASGELQNAKDVLSPGMYKKYIDARQSNKTSIIKSVDEVDNASAKPATATLTWKFKLQNARDVAWASSKAVIWDGATINLPSGKKAFAQSVYPIESIGNNGWERSTEFTKGSIENYSKRWFEYPYPSAINVASNVGGMEYPGIVFCGSMAKGSGLFGVTDHEFGHTWFPMIVGSNERKYGWMDEGFNTFINGIATKDFNHGEFFEQHNNADYHAFMFGPNSESIMHTPDAMKEGNIGNALYGKPGYGLELLRNQILDSNRFDYAFRIYIKNWAFKHPTPWDFFRSMDNAAGENLSWFWKAWFMENYALDQAIDNVTYVDNFTRKGAIVTLSNLDKMAMPVYLSYATVSGKNGNIKLPVEIWNNTAVFKVKLNTEEELKWVTIDPNKIFPDMNYSNNTWKKEQ